jgi:hypothetical protein
MKQKYIKPAMEIVHAEQHNSLLVDSDDNPYWKEGWTGPETPSGCQSGWWCGN